MADVEAVVVIEEASPAAVEVPVPATPIVVEVGFQGPPGPPGDIGDASFLDFEDTPNTYVGYESNFLRVTPAGDGVQFIPPPAGTGDVLGPVSSTHEHIAIFDGPSGKVIKDGDNTIAGVSDGGFF